MGDRVKSRSGRGLVRLFVPRPGTFPPASFNRQGGTFREESGMRGKLVKAYQKASRARSSEASAPAPLSQIQKMPTHPHLRITPPPPLRLRTSSHRECRHGRGIQRLSDVCAKRRRKASSSVPLRCPYSLPQLSQRAGDSTLGPPRHGEVKVYSQFNSNKPGKSLLWCRIYRRRERARRCRTSPSGLETRGSE